ncbi:MAG: hypothetical protein ACRETF_05880 [Nevskiaceae bacterium]
MSTLSKVLLLAALALPIPGLAQTPERRLSYTYGDARLVLSDPEGGDRLDGIRLGGSAQFHPDLFATGALTTLSSDGADFDTLELGLGFRHRISAITDVVGIAGLVWGDVDPGSDDSGISLTGGVRSRVQPQFEVGPYASYVELFGDGDASLIGEGLMHLSPQLALVGSLALSDDVTTLTFGGRWNFTYRIGS